MGLGAATERESGRALRAFAPPRHRAVVGDRDGTQHQWSCPLNARGVNACCSPFTVVLSGSLIPLTLYPDWMHRALFVQPFAGVVDIPFRMYSGNLAGAAAWAGLGLQLFWTVVLIVGGRVALERVCTASRCREGEPMGPIRLLTRYLSASMRAQMQYPGSAVILAVGEFVGTILDVIAIWALFDRFGAPRVGGSATSRCSSVWSASASRSPTSSAAASTCSAPSSSRPATSTACCLRPRSVTVQLIGHDFRVGRLGRFLQGVVVTAMATSSLHFHWGALTIALALWTIAGGVALFFGLIVIRGTIPSGPPRVSRRCTS